MSYRTLSTTEWAACTTFGWALLALSWVADGFDVMALSGIAVLLFTYLLVDRLARFRRARPTRTQVPGDDVL